MADWREISADWIGGTAFKTAGSNGVALQLGTLGEQKGVSPMEILLMGLAGCTGMDIADILGKQRQPLQAMQVKVRAHRAEDYPMIWDEIEVEYIVYGAVAEKELQRAIELSEQKYCSVGLMLEKAAHIRSSYRILPAEAAKA